MTIQILNKSSKKEIENKLRENFGIERIPGMLIQIGRERVYLFQGEISEKELKKLEQILPIERVGVYFAKIIDEHIKLSIEGVQILKNKISKNIFQLNDSQTEEWMMGKDLQIKTGKKGFIIIKNKDDFLGSGKASAEKIGNFIPKNRRLKEKG